MRLTVLRIALAFVFCAVAAGCSRSGSLTGKWRTSPESGGMEWEFFDNGAVIQGTTRGKYTLGDNNRLKVETPYATSVYQMERADDVLRLTDSRGSKVTLTRAK